MKLIIDIDDNDYDLINKTGITLDWNTAFHGKEKDKELTFAVFGLVKALKNGTQYEERTQDGEWIEEPSLNSKSYWKVQPKVYRCSKCRSRLTTRYIQKQRFCYYCGSANRPRREASNG